MPLHCEATKRERATGVGSAASYATANGGFVTPDNSSSAAALVNRSDPTDASREDISADGRASARLALVAKSDVGL